MRRMQLFRKIVLIGFFGSMTWFITFFGTTFILVGALGLPPPARYLGPWPTLILLFPVPWIVGGYIGYLVGKRQRSRTV